MIYQDTSAIAAVNRGQDTPDAFYRGSTLIATSEWKSTDGWRGYQKVTAEPGFKEVDQDWTTGDWDDAISDEQGPDATERKLKALEAKYGDIYVIFTPSSNVFSTIMTVLVKDETVKIDRGKAAGTATRLFKQDDGSFSVRYHATHVVRYDAATGDWTLDSGGWKTMTTKKRINQYLPDGYYISQKNYAWTLHTPDGPREFTDGMTFNHKEN